MKISVERVWAGLWFMLYVVVRVLLRMLIGRESRNRAMALSEFSYSRAYSIQYKSSAPYYEPHVRRVVSSAMRRGSVFIDAGAFHGYFSLVAWKFVKRRAHGLIIAVEADPDNFKTLVKYLPADRRIVKVNAALFTRDDELLTFHRGTDSMMSGSVHPTQDHFKHHLSGETIKVPSVRLDTLIRRYSVERVDLVKMDIEGAEHPVLTDPTLDLSRVQNMVVEVHYPYASRESMEIVRSLAGKGFKIIPLYPEENDTRCYMLACKGEITW